VIWPRKAREAHAAHVRVALDVEDRRHERAGGIGFDHLAAAVPEDDLVGAGRVVLEELDHLGQAQAGVRIADQDRHDGALDERVRQELLQLRVGDLLLLEVFEQPLLVLAGVHHLVHQLLAPGALDVLDRAPHAREARARAVGQQVRHAGLPERRAQLVDQRVVVRVGIVEVRHDQRAAAAERLRELHLLAQVVGHTARGAHDADHEVRAEERAAGLGVEVGIAGRVEEVPQLAVPVGRDDRHRQRVLLLLLLGFRVADARLVRDRALARGCARQMGQRVDEGGLPRGRVAHEGNVADAGSGEGHETLTPLNRWLLSARCARAGLARCRRKCAVRSGGRCRGTAILASFGEAAKSSVARCMHRATPQRSVWTRAAISACGPRSRRAGSWPCRPWPRSDRTGRAPRARSRRP